MDRRFLAAIAVVTFVAASIIGYVVLTNLGAPTTSPTLVTTTVTKFVTPTVTTFETITKTVTKTVEMTKTVYSTTTELITHTASLATTTTTTHVALQRPSVEIEFASYGAESLQNLTKVIEMAQLVPSSPYSYAYALLAKAVETTYATATTVAPLVYKASVAQPAVPYSTTNVQVSGVDELDIVKTDGRAVYYSKDKYVYIVDAKNLRLASVIKVGSYARGLYVWNGRLVVVCGGPPIRILHIERSTTLLPAVVAPVATRVLVYNVTNLYKPELLANVSISGYYLSSRMVNGVLYILTQSPAYLERGQVSLPIVGNTIAKPSNIQVLSPGDTYLVLLALNVTNLKGKAYAYLINRASIVYMTHDHLYVASNMFGIKRVIPELIQKYLSIVPSDLRKKLSELVKQGKMMSAYYELLNWVSKDYDRVRDFVKYLETAVGKEGAYVRVYVLRVKGLSVEVEGYVDVPGTLTKQFAINQLGKYLVLATVRYSIRFVVYKPPTYTATTGPSRITITICKWVNGSMTTSVSYLTVSYPKTVAPPVSKYFVYPRIELNSVGVYVIDIDKLRIAASIPTVIRNQYVYGARLVGTTLFLVTNRAVDPLFAIDLSNPLKPRIVGFVKLPGYLTYLHPISKDILLGIGVEKGNLKIELFNVSDLRNIKEVSKLVIEKGWSLALYDYHAITFWTERKLFMMPVSITWKGVGIAVISYAGNSLTMVKILEAPHAVRSVWIGNNVFAVSPNSIKVFNASTWKEIAEIKL